MTYRLRDYGLNRTLVEPPQLVYGCRQGLLRFCYVRWEWIPQRGILVERRRGQPIVCKEVAELCCLCLYFFGESDDAASRRHDCNTPAANNTWKRKREVWAFGRCECVYTSVLGSSKREIQKRDSPVSIHCGTAVGQRDHLGGRWHANSSLVYMQGASANVWVEPNYFP